MKFLNIKLVLIILLGSIVAFGQSPDITELEYYFDTDPGFGNGTSVMVSADTVTSTTFDLDISALDAGIHYAFIRAKDGNNVWSLVHKMIIHKVETLPVTTLDDIVNLEYFFDIDPGYGNGTPIAVVAGTISSTAFDIDISGLSAGFHKVYFRSQDENGIWSLIYVQNLVKVVEESIPPSTDVVDMEYFFDTDPGFGNGTPVAVTSGIITSTAFDIDISGLSTGFHKVYFRSKNENDIWSLNYIQNLVKVEEEVVPPSTDIIAMEYFFDTDPGFGNGTDVPITFDTVTSTAFDIDVSGLDAGHHKVYVRTKNENEVWGLAYIQNLVKVIEEPFEALPELLTLEYYFDKDPGFGNGTEVLFSPDSIVDLTFDVDISAEYPGDHNLYIRLKDENRRWSFSAIDSVFVKGIRVLLEGPFDPESELMSSALNDQDLIPLEQPFDSDPAAVWYYDGSETVAEIPNPNIVEWLLVQTRDATSAANATPATIKENQVAFLLNNGKIVGLDGNSNILFSEPIDDDLYLVVFQRNHLGVMSSVPVDITGDYAFTYLFSESSDQVFGGVSGHKEISTGLWGMFAGDADGNGEIHQNDKTNVWSGQAGIKGYNSGDMDLNNEVNNQDKNDVWLPNVGSSSQVPD